MVGVKEQWREPSAVVQRSGIRPVPCAPQPKRLPVRQLPRTFRSHQLLATPCLDHLHPVLVVGCCNSTTTAVGAAAASAAPLRPSGAAFQTASAFSAHVKQLPGGSDDECWQCVLLDGRPLVEARIQYLHLAVAAAAGGAGAGRVRRGGGWGGGGIRGWGGGGRRPCGSMEESGGAAWQYPACAVLL